MGRIKDSLFKLEDEKVLAEVQKTLDAGVPPEKVLEECKTAMVAFSEAFLQGKMFVSDLLISGVIFEDINKLVMPRMKASAAKKNAGKVVIGTVKNDIHNIGKIFVSNMLAASGFEVIDVGVDVPPKNFIEAVGDSNARALAMSCLLANCYDSIKETVEALEKAGLRDRVKIIIGGGWVDAHVVRYSGADAFGFNPQQCVHFCEEVYAR
ncbi:methionine synthase [Treponema primitia ZAS-2]|uniref:Methionine synthase n=1 Tax=Treponema primitia (strain ATCC BAA-887 / DSM 12427 / ZAS-2) TaxID=545694 RepID=F5YP89_TREPZ|nr:cobalamin-dependent protein [Treponema primitia]AEF87043.1 methionine synthase [Treponema primitia ZAS-2]